MPEKYKILIVDDDAGVLEMFDEFLRKEGYSVTKAYSGQAGLDFLQDEIFDLVITDIRMPDVTGQDILHAIKKNSPEIPVVLITAFGTVEAAISAMKEGAYDYISKPFRIDEVSIIVRRALEQKRMLKEYQYLKEGIKEKYKLDNIVGRSNEMFEVYKTVAKIAPSRSTVLITGESGTGKELVARAIHENSPRKDSPFVVIHCASIPETLIESELFGYMKGAFTGAAVAKKGLFEEADTGTCFLDEVGDVPLNIQVKLLRVLQEREIRRIGADQPKTVDVRIIAATNRDLDEMIKEGTFREDLFYRLSVVSIHLPSLRGRKEDISLLANHFVQKYAIDANLPSKVISEEALKYLNLYHWPGNVRELENVIERAVNLSYHQVIMPEDLPDKIRQPKAVVHSPLFEENLTMDELEHRYLESTLNATNWNYNETAEKLGISVKTIRRMIDKYNLQKNSD